MKNKFPEYFESQQSLNMNAQVQQEIEEYIQYM